MAIISGALLALKAVGGTLLKSAAKGAVKGAAKRAAKGAVKDKLKDTLKKKGKEKIKKIAKDKLIGMQSGGSRGGAIVKMGLPSSDLTKTDDSVSSAEISSSPGGDKLLNEVIEIKVTTIKIKDLLASNLAKQKAADDAARRQAEKERKAAREDELESQKETTKKSGVGLKAPKVGPFEAIKRFLLFTFLGSLLAFALKHREKILAVLKFIEKNVSASIKIFLALRKAYKMAVKFLLKKTLQLTKKLFTGSINLIGKVIKKSGTIIFDTLKIAANALFNFLKVTIETALKFAKEVAKGVTKLGEEFLKRGAQVSKYLKRIYRATSGAIKGGQGIRGAAEAVKTATQRSARAAGKRAAQEAAEKVAKEAAEKVAKEAAEKVAKEAAEKVGQEAVEKVGQEAAEKVAQEAAEKVAQEAAEKVVQEGAEKVAQKGAEQVAKKAGKSFLSRIPFLGGLITAIVSLASGEPVTQAIFKAAGSVLGGFLGSFIPIPIIGTLVGELIGEYVGDLFYTGLMGGGMDAVGKKLQEDIKSILAVGDAIKNWVGDGFRRINEGIPSVLGVKNYLVLFNPIESVPLFFKAFFTRDSMTEKKEKSNKSNEETKVEQKFFGGVVNAAKNFLGFSGDSFASQSSVSSGGLVKEPTEYPGMTLTKIPLKNGETYYGVRMDNILSEKIGGLGRVFGIGGNTDQNRRNPSGSGVSGSPSVQSGPSTYSSASYKEDPEFEKEVNRLAQKYDIDATDLLGLMASESGLNPQARNRSGATGLIQFMPTTAKALGTTTEELYKMNRVQQMKYVEKYFDYWKLPRGATAGHLYTSVFLPAFTNKSADYIVAKRGGFTDSWGRHPASWYTQNSGLDSNNDGSISIAELGARIQKKKVEFGIASGEKSPVAAKKETIASQQMASSPQIVRPTTEKGEGESEYDTSKHGTPGGPKIGKGFNPGKGDTSRRIFLHWTAADYNTPFNNYHTTFLGDGTPVRTTPNYGIDKTKHTGGANDGSVGLSIAAMAGGREDNFGSYPPKKAQLQAMALEAASLAKAWGWSESTIDKNVMTHGEWERYATSTGKLPGPPQRWDLDKVFSPKEAIGAGGDYMRKLIKMYFKGVNDGSIEPPVEGKTMESESESIGGQSTPSPQIASRSDSDSDSEESKFEFEKVYNPDGSLNFNKTFIHPDLQTGGTFGAAVIKGGEEGMGSANRLMGSSTIGSKKPPSTRIESNMLSLGKDFNLNIPKMNLIEMKNPFSTGESPENFEMNVPIISDNINTKQNKSISFGTSGVKNYKIEESAEYDEPTPQVILLPPPPSENLAKQLSIPNTPTQKRNSVMPLFTDIMIDDISYTLYQAALF